jgi:signal transduction histidine kinase/ActR/RegA family two-component response regulator
MADALDQPVKAKNRQAFASDPDVAALMRDTLNPYVAVGSSVIAILGILAHWPSDYPAVTVATFLTLTAVSIVLGLFWKTAKGTPDRLILASAATFLPLTGVLVVVSGGLDSPMWLLFMVGSLTTAFSRAKMVPLSLVLTCVVALIAMWAPNLLEQGFVLSDLYTVAIRLIALVLVWKMTHTATTEIARVILEISMLEKERSKAIAENLEVREQLRQAQKMDALGRLAGGIAHDFNNLLTIILGVSTLLREEHKGQQELCDGLDEISKASERAAELTQQLLQFSRHETVDADVLNLNEVLQGTERMLTRLIDENIDFRIIPFETPVFIHANRGELEQVVVNLVINARDSMPTGGKLTITCDRQFLPVTDPILGSGMRPGTHVILRLSDTGIGMTEPVAAKAFEPFFTTKALGTGSGLGLATVYGIISKYNGNILIDTEPGRGTTFTIAFREAEHQPIRATDEVRRDVTTRVAVGDVQIVIVEDAPRVRDVIVRSLEGANYQVSSYENPDFLLADAKRMRTPFHLLITDIIMPGMSGVELVRTLRDQNIFTPTLFISGYTGDASLASVKTPNDALLMKPFNRTELLQAVSEVLSTWNVKLDD